MKKTVIKRRKRVPAASSAAGGNVSTRMSDQAAAEALVAVGRSGLSPSHGEESDADDQPRKKRTRRSAKTSREKDEDVLMDGEDEDDGRRLLDRAPSRNQDYLRSGLSLHQAGRSPPGP
ncbi:hypothetical protein NLJ89_g11334 [Agrocybe chaxingu]|uniref:Uncharacterized protein n=1 Tax=Agrocybe chaxingu TaxID=84603 RepID=A0A9W8JWZ5_9AGAR|nr:hypothetical protein NLJ89_g11334 [Agrocybe chaxingu]